MAPQDELEHYEAIEAQDLTRLLRALRPPERAVQVPTQVDINIRAEIWKAQVLRQVITLLSMARWELIQVIRQALMDNPMLEEVARSADEDAPAGEDYAQHLTASADDMMDGQELYDSIWQECVPDNWEWKDLPSRPGLQFTSTPSEAIVPDVIVKKVWA